VDFLSSLSSRNQPLLTRVRRQVAANCPRLPSRDGNLRSHDCKDATLIRHLESKEEYKKHIKWVLERL